MGRTFGIIIAVECLSADENIETNLLNTILSHSEQGTSVYVSWDSVYCDEESYLHFLAKCMSYFHVSIIPSERNYLGITLRTTRTGLASMSLS